MRILTRMAVSIALAVVASVALAIPASAATLIKYQGETSAPSPNRVVASS